MFILPGRTGEIHDRRQLGYHTSATEFEPGTSQLKSRIAINIYTMFCVCVCLFNDAVNCEEYSVRHT